MVLARVGVPFQVAVEQGGDLFIPVPLKKRKQRPFERVKCDHMAWKFMMLPFHPYAFRPKVWARFSSLFHAGINFIHKCKRVSLKILHLLKIPSCRWRFNHVRGRAVDEPHWDVPVQMAVIGRAMAWHQKVNPFQISTVRNSFASQKSHDTYRALLVHER